MSTKLGNGRICNRVGIPLLDFVFSSTWLVNFVIFYCIMGNTVLKWNVSLSGNTAEPFKFYSNATAKVNLIFAKRITEANTNDS